ncbi:MAG: hypothetical protein GX568_09705 [Candidatus Gastranaerophilales bacterium]|nr:hypothetical protein [Candidatus Gastranaerophilales bacterium]
MLSRINNTPFKGYMRIAEVKSDKVENITTIKTNSKQDEELNSLFAKLTKKKLTEQDIALLNKKISSIAGGYKVNIDPSGTSVVIQPEGSKDIYMYSNALNPYVNGTLVTFMTGSSQDIYDKIAKV